MVLLITNYNKMQITEHKYDSINEALISNDVDTLLPFVAEAYEEDGEVLLSAFDIKKYLKRCEIVEEDEIYNDWEHDCERDLNNNW